MDREIAFLNDAPILSVFHESPTRLRPHFLGGNPIGDAEKALSFYENNAVSRAQAGATFQPDWKRWDDPNLFADADDYWQRLRANAEVVKDQGGYAWIYDEPGYPSGSIGMRVLDGHPELQSCGVACVWKDVKSGTEEELELPEGTLLYACAAPVSERGFTTDSVISIAVPSGASRVSFKAPDAGAWRLMAFVRVPFYEGTFTENRRSTCTAQGRHTRAGDATFNWEDPKYAYPNLLDPRAVERIIEVGYEPYARHAGQYLGETIKAFFTDEPLIPRRSYIPGKLPASVPWYDGLADEFKARCGYDVREKLPALFFDFQGDEIEIRCDFYDLIADAFATNFVRRMAQWCAENDVHFTGHLYGEEFLSFHITSYGSIMRAAREMTMPGIDQLGGGFVGRSLMNMPTLAHTSTFGGIAPKFISSAAHLADRARTISESHGFSGRKRGTTYSDFVATANWQTVLGINTLPYYSFDWVDATAEQKREYSRYAGRLSYMTSGGVHHADVAVLYPIATGWAHHSPLDSAFSENRRQEWTDESIDRLQSMCDDVSRALLERQLDFDFLEEDDIASAKIEGGKLRVGQELFSAIVLPGAEVVSANVMKKLDKFLKAGGRVFAAGALPKHGWDRDESKSVRRIADSWADDASVFESADPIAIAEAVAAAIDRDVVLEPSFTGIYVLHRSKGGRDIYLLVNNSADTYEGNVSFRLNGRPQLWNPWNGRAYALKSAHNGDRTEAAIRIAGRTAFFVVFGADSESVAERDDAMWAFGPQSTSLQDRLNRARDAAQKRCLGDAHASRKDLPKPQWTLLAPDGQLTLAATEQEDAVLLEIPPWRRLGCLYEGLEEGLSLDPGVYEIEMEVLAENLEMWALVPRHSRNDEEVFDHSGNWLAPRHHLIVPGPHGWANMTFAFKVPEGADRTRILLFPLDKVYFSKPATLGVRRAGLRKLESK